MVNRGGKVCLAAFPHEETPVDVAHIVRNNIYLYGIRGEGKSATHRAEAFMTQKRFDATKIHTHTFPLDDLPTAIRYAKDRVEDAIKVVVKARGVRPRTRSRRSRLPLRASLRLRHRTRRTRSGEMPWRATRPHCGGQDPRGKGIRRRPRRNPGMGTVLPGALPVAMNGVRVAARSGRASS